jgi:hypothetical protein
MTATADANPLSLSSRPLQRVGKFSATNVRALADFTHLNAAARECVTRQSAEAFMNAFIRDVERGKSRAAVRCAMRSECLAPALLAIAKSFDIAMLVAVSEVDNVPASWSLSTPLAQWDALTFGSQRTPPTDGNAITLSGRALTGRVDWARIPSKLVELDLSDNDLEGEVPFALLPATLRKLNLRGNRRLTGRSAEAGSPFDELIVDNTAIDAS